METTNREIEGKTSCWYAVYTAGRAEKKVKERLDKAGIGSYLPLQSVIRLWNNRKRKVMIPVVPGYIFVHLSVGDVAKVKSVKGVSFLLREEGRYVSIPECQMEVFRSMVENTGEFIEFAEELTPGITVRVTRGQLEGATGELLDCQGKNKLMLRIAGLGCALVTVASDAIEKVR